MSAKTKQIIWFVSINTVELVHAQGLGFTKQYYTYAFAATAAEAAELCKQWYEVKRGIKCLPIKEAACKPASQQDLGSYTFPNQIINIPEAMLTEIYDRRGYPASLRTKAFRV